MAEQPLFLPVADAYDRWSGFYDAYDNPMVFGAEQVVRALDLDLGGKHVIEFGCGTGRNLAILQERGAASLTGIDLSSGMLARARARDPTWNLLRHDMTMRVPLPDRSADLVLFSLALEHVSDMVAPLHEAKRILREGGVIEVIEIHPFMSLGGAAAHFEDGGQTVQMPTVPHRFSDYLNAFAREHLRVAACREWRPRDWGKGVPAKALKRGPDFPLIVEFALTA